MGGVAVEMRWTNGVSVKHTFTEERGTRKSQITDRRTVSVCKLSEVPWVLPAAPALNRPPGISEDPQEENQREWGII